MKTTLIRCSSSSPSAPARERGCLPEGAATPDAKAAFCVLAMPIEDEVRDLFERAMAAETMAELYEAWAGIDERRAASAGEM